MKKVKDLKELIEKEKFGKDDCAMYWLHDQILIQKASEAPPALENLVEARIFNDECELFYFKRAGQWVDRVKRDAGLTARQDYFENEVKIKGIIASKLKKVYDHLAETSSDKTNIIYLKKRDYIEYNKVGAASYVDSRFVIFMTK